MTDEQTVVVLSRLEYSLVRESLIQGGGDAALTLVARLDRLHGGDPTRDMVTAITAAAAGGVIPRWVVTEVERLAAPGASPLPTLARVDVREGIIPVWVWQAHPDVGQLGEWQHAVMHNRDGWAIIVTFTP